MTGFGDLPGIASLNAIYGQAGKIFEEQVKRDTETDYNEKEAFNKAIWFIAEAAQRQGFINLRGMTTERIAQGMGDYIVKWLKGKGWRF